MQRSLVSIGIPTWNRVSMLKRTVESALAQDYSNLEIVISDNASTDGTEEFCRTLSDRESRVRYMRQPVDAGQIINLAEVLNHAKGEYFMWLGDDDWLDEDYLSRCMEILETNPDYAMVAGRTRWFRGEKHAYDAPAVSLLQETGSMRVSAYFAELWGNEIFYGVMRRHIAQTLPPFQNVIGFDCLISAAVAFAGKVRTIEATWINRTLGGTSETPEKLASVLGLPSFQATFYRESVAWFAFREIAWRGPAFRSLGLGGRLALAARASANVFSLPSGVLRGCSDLFLPALLIRAMASVRYRIKKARQKYLGRIR